jgi:hypothetical protein
MRNQRAFYFAATPVFFLLFLSLGSRLMENSLEPSPDAPAPIRRASLTGYVTPRIVPVSAETQKILENLVVDQITAIRKEDYAAAIRCALPAMRRQWTEASFGSMIKANFTLIPNSKTQRCQVARASGNTTTMLVRLAGKREGVEGACVYSFGKSNNQWFIAGCIRVISSDPTWRMNSDGLHSPRISNGDLDSLPR